MKFRNLTVLLFAAACGGGSDPKPQPVDSTPSDSVGVFPNSKNDVVYFNPVTGGDTESTLTPTEDAPDNATAVTIASTGSTRFSGEMGIAGDHGDEYFERDTFLIATDANTNTLTVRLDWEGGASDHDFVLYAEPAAGETDLLTFASGTIVSNDRGEFQTFPVDPSRNYLLWSGVYAENAPPGGAPTLPSPYDFSVYGEAITEASITGACSFTEAADVSNDILSEGVPPANKAEVSGQTLTTGKHVYCGALNTGHFVPDADDPTFGIVDVDSFSLNVNLENGPDLGNKIKITLTGKTPADTAKLAAMLQVEYEVLNDVTIDGAPAHQFFVRGFFQNSHGILTSTLPLSTTIDDEDPQSPTAGQVVGPKSIAILAFDAAAIAANIDYKIEIAADVPDTRAPRLTTGGTVEANDN